MLITELLLSLTLVLAGSQAAVGQPLSAQSQTVASRTALVTVVDRRNRPLIDLLPDDFVVREGGTLREILNARIADYPIVVLLDNSVEAGVEFEEVRRTAVRFVGRVGQRPVAVGTLADPPAMVATFEDSRATVMERLDAIVPSPSGTSRFLTAAAAAALVISQTGTPFSAIVVISASPIDRNDQAPTETIRAVLDSRASVYVIANHYSAAPRGVIDPVTSLVRQTHGQLTPIFSSASYQAALDHLADQLAKEIMVEYLVPPRSSGEDAKLGVRIPGAKVNGLGVR